VTPAFQLNTASSSSVLNTATRPPSVVFSRRISFSFVFSQGKLNLLANFSFLSLILASTQFSTSARWHWLWSASRLTKFLSADTVIWFEETEILDASSESCLKSSPSQVACRTGSRSNTSIAVLFIFMQQRNVWCGLPLIMQ